MYHGINLLWENFSNELLISYIVLILGYLIIVIECFRITYVLKKINLILIEIIMKKNLFRLVL